MVSERVCEDEADDFYSITEDSECLLTTGDQCVQDDAGQQAVVCETLLIQDCPQQDVVPPNIDEYGAPAAPVLQHDNIDEYGAPQAPVVEKDVNNCVPKTKQVDYQSFDCI